MENVQAKAEVLGRLLIIQEALHALPNEMRIGEFTRRALAAVPGVSDVLLIHFHDPMLSLDAKRQEICAQCESAGYPVTSVDPVLRTDQSGIHYYPVRTASHLFGMLIVRADDETLLRPYLDFLSNIANAIGRVLGTRLYESQLSKSNELLTQSSQELVRSNAELQQIVYVASHDLQEPLRMVASYLQLLEQRYGGRLEADAHDFIGFAVEGAKRMQTLINDLLAYSGVGTRAQPQQPTDCTAVVATALRSLSVALEESGAQVQFGALPVVMADAMQLTQLFQNLLGNAIKFRGPQAPRIAVWAEPDDGFWRFAVQDNGIGIAPEYFERIFVMFQRLHSRSKYPGTGIGLAICKKIVERHGGRIWVEAAPQQGSIFKFTLPKPTGAGHE